MPSKKPGDIRRAWMGARWVAPLSFNDFRAGTCEMEISIVFSEEAGDSHQMEVEGGLQGQLV
jgi:hypothetical protein